MKKQFQFWWAYITNRSFRTYVHTNDLQKFNDKILRMVREKSEYESRVFQESCTKKLKR